MYTPFTALLLTPLAWLPEPLGIGGWTFLNCLALGILLLLSLIYVRPHPALTATATALATVVLGVLLLPEPSSTYFGSKLSGLENVVDLGTNFATSGNSSLQGVAERWVGTHSLLLLAPLLLAVVAVAFSQAHRELACGDGFAAAAVLGCATCLLSPVSWLHHWVWVIPTLAVLVTRGRAARALAIIWMLACLAQLTDLGDLAAHAGWPIIPVEIMRSSIVLLALLAMVVLYLPSQRKAHRERHPARHRRPTL
ncbi:glycosyltransferase 87 family protein [Rothia nasimurium]|uniref:glycosyltransferase 87 family protein n=1 Tax=Rothia nasimurium TaxID=85336 RepID=UPI001F00B85D|nr:glycosyltransferase 87 family protein [Rothia nasimurium]